VKIKKVNKRMKNRGKNSCEIRKTEKPHEKAPPGDHTKQ